MRPIPTILAVVSAMFGVQALAQQQPNLEDVFFQQFDADKDGVVTMDEFLRPQQEQLEAQYRHMDRNSDGRLDRGEVKAFNDEMSQRMREMQQRMQQQGAPQGMPRR